MKEPPKCDNPKCENKAKVGLGTGFYCVDCLIKYQKAQQSYVQGIMNGEVNGSNNMP